MKGFLGNGEKEGMVMGNFETSVSEEPPIKSRSKGEMHPLILNFTV